MSQRPDWDTWALGIARAVATRGDCTRLQVGAAGEQPGFPEGEWMCWFCICGDYGDDRGWPRPDVFPDPRVPFVSYTDLIHEAERYRANDLNTWDF